MSADNTVVNRNLTVVPVRSSTLPVYRFIHERGQFYYKGIRSENMEMKLFSVKIQLSNFGIIPHGAHFLSFNEDHSRSGTSI